MEPLRREALIRAAILEIGVSGSLEVTVSTISKRAGMSSALAHHYFGSKDEMIIAAMRHILAEFGASISARLALIEQPYMRLDAIIDTSLDEKQFKPEVVAAWMSFYVRAQKTPQVSRLLNIYSQRLLSNLRFELKRLTSKSEAENMAHILASLIDGFYIRQALSNKKMTATKMKTLIMEYVDLKLQKEMK